MWKVIVAVLFVVVFANGSTTKRKIPSTELYELINTNLYPDAFSLPDVLESLAQTPQGRAFLTKLLKEISNRTGFPIPDPIVLDILNDSAKLLDMARFSIADVSDIYSDLTLAYWSGEVSNVNSTDPKMPNPFKFPDDIFTAPINISDYIPKLEPIGDDLYFGFPFLNATGSHQAQINVVMAFVFNQLVANIHADSSKDLYAVEYGGKSYTSVEDFLTALQVDGYEVSTYLEWHVSQFYGLYKLNKKTGKKGSVADPVFLTTGIFNADKTKEVTLPAVHSQWMMKINSTKKNLEFSLVWYQGDSAYGFFPGQMYLITEWAGRSTTLHISGAKAIRAIKLMALTQDIFLRASKRDNLYDYGYGVTGVCDDSCSIIEIIMSGETKMYPLLMQKQFVLPEILDRVQKGGKYLGEYHEILNAVNQITPDWMGLNPTSHERALANIVWPAGKEPWQVVVDARKILTGKILDAKTN